MKQTEIEQLLPEIFRATAIEGSPLGALLGVMQLLHEHPEAVLTRLDRYFDPYQTPDPFVPFLSSWVDLDMLLTEGQTSFPAGIGRLRDLIAAAAYLSRWRGTAKGLLHFLETATGIPGFTVEEAVPGPDGTPIPYHIRVRAPDASAPYRTLIEQIIRLEKPAYVTYDLLIAQPDAVTRINPVVAE